MSLGITEVAFWLAAALAVYPWLGYPLLLALLARRPPPPALRALVPPFLSVIVAAYNEAAAIRAKLASALEDDYPRDRLEVIVVSDGSTDGTDRLVASYGDRRARLVRQEPRAGKSPALNRGVALARGDVLVFTDANAAFAPGALGRLAAPFTDPRVGLVSGQGLYAAAGARDAQAVGNGYVRFEAFVRSHEATLGVLAGADGAIYALRRGLYRELGPAEVNDLAHPIDAALAGFTARFEPGALTLEPPSADARQEFRRHVRIVAQNVHLLAKRLPHIVAGRRWRLAWILLSHRVARWLTAPALALALGANLVLVGTHPIYAATALVQGAFYALALAGFAGERAGVRLGRAALPYYFCVVIAAGLCGLARALGGGAEAVWAPRGGARSERPRPERAA